MQDYSTFEVKDFLSDEAFCRWVLRNENADTIFWKNWLAKNQDRGQTVQAARKLLLEVRSAQNYITDEDLEKELEKISLARKNTHGIEVIQRNNIFKTTWKYWTAIAAVLAGIVFYLNLPSKEIQNVSYRAFISKNQIIKSELVEYINNESSSKEIRLEDGSLVRLSPNSKISYPLVFAENNREVFLRGEAFFEITKNPMRPFKVFSHDIVTTVLGTSFIVSDYDDGSPTKVVVKTGKVTVATTDQTTVNTANQQDEIILLPNQQVVFNRNESKLKRTLVAAPQLLVAPDIVEQSLKFERAPVASVFNELEKSYGVQIVYDSEVLSGCELTAEFGQEPLFDKIDMICKAIQGHYEIIDGQIVIHGTSCGNKKR